MGADMIFQLMCVASSQYSGFAAVGSIGPYMHGVKVGTVQANWAKSAVGYSETCDPTPAKPLWQAMGTKDDANTWQVSAAKDALGSWNDVADAILRCTATVTTTKRNDLVECHERAVCTDMEPTGKTEICIYEGMEHIYPSVPTAPQKDYSDANGAGASYQATPAAWALWNKHKPTTLAPTTRPPTTLAPTTRAASGAATAALSCGSVFIMLASVLSG